MSTTLREGATAPFWRHWANALQTCARGTARAPVIALPCSGAGAGQWRALADELGPRFRLTAPEHFGSPSTGPWNGAHAFTLADEAARTIELIDRSAEKVHLVGHSYGGGVALHVALARPARIASLSLYEPSAFHLLKAMGEQGMGAYAEIASLANETCEHVVSGDFKRAAIGFVDYWGGAGAWNALRPSLKSALIGWIQKAPLDFHALMEEPTPMAAYAGLTVPTLILCGEYAPPPTRIVAMLLAALMPRSRLDVLEGAGHMGPLTHAAAVNEMFAAHIGQASSPAELADGFARPSPSLAG